MIENLQFIVIVGLFIIFFLSIIGFNHRDDSDIYYINSTQEENESLLGNKSNNSEKIVNIDTDINTYTDNVDIIIDSKLKTNKCSQRKIDLDYMNKLV